MRIVCTLNNQDQGRQLSAFLASEGIDNQLEINTNNDWGTSTYGDTSCRIWVYDEDRVEEALRWVESFIADPTQPLFHKTKPQVVMPTEILGKDDPIDNGRASSAGPKATKDGFKISTYLILICCILFLVDTMSSPTITAIPTYLPATPLLASELKKETMYDYPETYVLVDRLENLYGIDKLLNPEELPSEAQYLIKQIQQTPYWQGFYSELLKHKTPEKSTVEAPLFEKIKEGEVWRLITPCLMHSDILHILFNMLWLSVLGSQMEQRLGGRRYLLFALVAGIFSNTCQYLMSGANFIGYSGILCAMLTFIWMRQKIAPWESYPLEKSTFSFLMIFIIAMFFIQLGSFFLENYQEISISPGIANTAHLSGALIGACMGRLSFFSWKT